MVASFLLLLQNTVFQGSCQRSANQRVIYHFFGNFIRAYTAQYHIKYVINLMYNFVYFVSFYFVFTLFLLKHILDNTNI